MKKFISLSLVFLLGIVLVAGCGKDKSKKKRRDRSDRQEESSGRRMVSPSRLRAMQGSVVNNLKQIGNALEMYSQGTRGWYKPHGILANGRHAQNDPAAAFDALFSQGHLVDARVYISPYDDLSTPATTGVPMRPENTSYAYIYVSPQYSSASAVAFEKPWTIPDNSDKISILYADGHVASHTVPGVSRMSCRELISTHPEIFGLYPHSDISFADIIDRTRPTRR